MLANAPDLSTLLPSDGPSRPGSAAARFNTSALRLRLIKIVVDESGLAVVGSIAVLLPGLYAWRRRIWLLFASIVVCLVFDATATPAYAQSTHGCGDLDRDGRVSAIDALQILAAAVGLHDCSPCDCDVDCNREISVGDALAVLRVAVGFPDEVACCVVNECFSDDDCQPNGQCEDDTFACDRICVFPATTTTSTTTTTVPVPPQDLRCPAAVELTAFARTGARCETDADCRVGTCNGSIGRCNTSSRLDSGYTGLSHQQDGNDGVRIGLKLRCPGPAEPICGGCQVVGLDPSAGNCRCAADNRTVCDEPFTGDDDDCGGGQCWCYNGPPVPSSPGGTPICAVERFVGPISGRMNVDDGSHDLAIQTKRILYLGEDNTSPCSICQGDVVAGDGKRDGTCIHGEDEGLACDVDAFHRTFPLRLSSSPDNVGQSLDCFPLAGKNVSGTGVLTSYTQTTGAVEPVDRNLECDLVVSPSIRIPFRCHCGLCGTGVCASDGSISCATPLDCPLAQADHCQQVIELGAAACRDDADCIEPGSHKCVGAFGFTQPNSCGPPEDQTCLDLDEGLGQCEAGPSDRFCDDVVGADGNGFIPCLFDGDCDPLVIGIAAGRCTLARKRPCFADRVSAAGTSDARQPVGAALFCAAPTLKASLNGVIGLPGLERRLTHYTATYSCAGDPTANYEPGIGGCP